MGKCLQTRFARHGLTPQGAPKQCPLNGVWRMLWGSASRHGLPDTVKKHVVVVTRLENQQEMRTDKGFCFFGTQCSSKRDRHCC